MTLAPATTRPAQQTWAEKLPVAQRPVARRWDGEAPAEPGAPAVHGSAGASLFGNAVARGGSVERVASAVGLTRREKLQRVGETLVGGTFFGTLMRQVRQSPFKSELFSGGRAGEAYGSMYDQHLAERMARGGGRKLVDAIVRKLERADAYRRNSRMEKNTQDDANNPYRNVLIHVAPNLRA